MANTIGAMILNIGTEPCKADPDSQPRQKPGLLFDDKRQHAEKPPFQAAEKAVR